MNGVSVVIQIRWKSHSQLACAKCCSERYDTLQWSYNKTHFPSNLNCDLKTIPEMCPSCLYVSLDEMRGNIWTAVIWASYQIRKTAGFACAGNAGNVFPAIAG